MTNLNKAVELLTAIALSEREDEKPLLLQELRSLYGCSSYSCIEEAAQRILADVGVPCNLSGYDYCVTAICMLVRNPELKRGITYRLYPEVANTHHATSSKVERGIRHAVEVAFDRCDWSTLNEYFGNSASPNKGRLTNSEFLCRLAEEVKWRGGPA